MDNRTIRMPRLHVGNVHAAIGGLTLYPIWTGAPVEEQLRAARPLPGPRGVVVAASGHPMLAEVCDHPDTLAQRWDALLSGLALHAATAAPVPTPGHRVRTFVRRIGRAAQQAALSVGIGWSVEAEDRDIVSLRGIADEAGLLYALALNPRHELVLAA